MINEDVDNNAKPMDVGDARCLAAGAVDKHLPKVIKCVDSEIRRYAGCGVNGVHNSWSGIALVMDMTIVPKVIKDALIEHYKSQGFEVKSSEYQLTLSW